MHASDQSKSPQGSVHYGSRHQQSGSSPAPWPSGQLHPLKGVHVPTSRVYTTREAHEQALRAERRQLFIEDVVYVAKCFATTMVSYEITYRLLNALEGRKKNRA